MAPAAEAEAAQMQLERETTFLKARDDANLPPAGPLEDFDVILSDRDKLKGTLRKMGSNTGEPDIPLGELIRQVSQGGGQNPIRAEGLSGLGGMLGHGLTRAALGKVGPGGRFDPGMLSTASSEGQIDDYFFDYAGDRSGRLRVTTWVTTPHSPGISTTVGYRFHVRVEPGGFTIHEKDTSDPNNVFPNTWLRIPASMAAPFKYKLWATGDDIVIERVWVDHNNDGTFDEILSTSTGWKANYKYLLDAQPTDCIDIMFAEDTSLPPPFFPTRYDQLTGPPQYCLGRCASPPLINTK